MNGADLDTTVIVSQRQEYGNLVCLTQVKYWKKTEIVKSVAYRGGRVPVCTVETHGAYPLCNVSERRIHALQPHGERFCGYGAETPENFHNSKALG